MSDLESVYQHASECAGLLNQAFAELPEDKMTVSRARRCLSRARTSFGTPAVSHKRRVRLCRETLELLEQALVCFETSAGAVETAQAIRRAERRLRQVQLSSLSDLDDPQ